MRISNYTNTLHTIIFFCIFSISSSLASNFSDNPCDELYAPGLVGQDQTICLSDNNPVPIENLESASNGANDFEYLWIFATSDPNVGTVVWLSIPGATGESYDPPALFQTTWFRRCARPIGCAAFGAESNIIKIEVKTCENPCLSFDFEGEDLRNPACNGEDSGRIEIEIIGGEAPYQYSWSHTSNHNPIQDNLTAGNYELIVFDANNCVISRSFELTQPDALKAAHFQQNATCNGANDGMVHLEIEGGTTPYTYTLNNNLVNNPNFENLAAGNYEFVATDKNGCTQNIEVTIEEPQKLEVFSNVINETCFENDGAINLEITGGTAPFDITWINGLNEQNLENIAAGKYSLSVADENDCPAWHEVEIEDECNDLVIDYQENNLELTSNNEVKISWTTFNEKADGIYLIECSLDGTNFEIIDDSVIGFGYDENGTNYQRVDKNPRNGMNYYRISHISANGEFSTTASFSVYVEKEDMPKISVFPNPVVNNVSIDFLQSIDENTNITLVDAFGKNIIAQDLETGNRFYDLNVADLPSGSYFLTINKGNNNPFIQTIIKE